jgi:hypothetical protein
MQIVLVSYFSLPKHLIFSSGWVIAFVLMWIVWRAIWVFFRRDETHHVRIEKGGRRNTLDTMWKGSSIATNFQGCTPFVSLTMGYFSPLPSLSSTSGETCKVKKLPTSPYCKEEPQGKLKKWSSPRYNCRTKPSTSPSGMEPLGHQCRAFREIC